MSPADRFAFAATGALRALVAAGTSLENGERGSGRVFLAALENGRRVLASQSVDDESPEPGDCEACAVARANARLDGLSPQCIAHRGA